MTDCRQWILGWLIVGLALVSFSGCESNCGDGVDDDGDGQVDCADRECFGDPDFCSTEHDCLDGLDNDLDGFVDCDDSDCADLADATETFCDDSIDNDCDGRVDCNDPDCASLYYCTYESYCNNYIDDDGDGLIDCDDPDCRGVSNCIEYEVCNDGWDNDDDGLVDCADPDCEGDINCGTMENCHDGWDNDYDGYTDCQDLDCVGDPWCGSEAGYCYDGYDNDGDGLVDCADPDCSDEWDCSEGWHCDDGVDNDYDGLLDCADPDCALSIHCSEAANCFDGIDNDMDGDVDCADSECSDLEECAAEGYWELFVREEGPPDIIGYTLTFTPDETDPNGYGLSVEYGVGGIEPGTGDAYTILGLSNDDFEEYDLELMPEIELYGIPYTSLFVSSNGYVTFERGSTSRSASAAAHFTFPSVAGYRADLNPQSRGAVTIDETEELVAVTFEEVIAVGNASPNTFQIIIHADGVIELEYWSLASLDAVVGISSGGASYPPETDYVP